MISNLKQWFLLQGGARRRGRFVLGVDQGTHAVRYVLWDREKQRVAGWKKFEIETGDAGEQKRRSVSEILREIVRDLSKPQIAAVHIHLQGESLVTGHLELPDDGKPVDAARIKIELRSKLGFPLDRAGYLWRDAGLRDGGTAVPHQGSSDSAVPAAAAGGMRIIHYAACQKTSLASLIELYTAVFDVIPEITTQGYAQEGLLAVLGAGDRPGATALVSGGRGITSISIFKQGKLVFEREIPLAGQDITRSIFINFLQGHAMRSSSDLAAAEALKKKSLIPLLYGSSPQTAADNAGLLGEEENRKLYLSMQGVLGAWLQDLRLSFAYFNEHYDSTPVTQIFLLGGMANHRNLDRHLRRELDVPVNLIRSEPRPLAFAAEASGNLEFLDFFNEYATAAALALKKPGEFNLVPAEAKTLDWSFLLKPALRIFSAAALIFCVAGFGFLQAQEIHYKQVKIIVTQHRGFLKLLEGPFLEMNRWEQFFAHGDYGAVPAPGFLKRLGRITPGNMLLTSLSINRRSAQLYLEGTLYGDAKNRAITQAEFTKALKESGWVEQLEMPAWEPSGSGVDKGTFKMTGRLVVAKGGKS